MDRGHNLEALAEEDDEEEMEEEHKDKDSDTDASSTDTDDEPDIGTKRGEPNKFDILCDGVNNAMALVHTAMEELLDMKDEMLRHSLPPTVLIKLATNTGKVFRSVSDLNMPVNELVRLVRVYSTPWEEKSAALKKLHEDYEAKQRQLNIAIKRLQLVDAHSKRIAREKRVMNWEKLFAKLMSNKGHGRRWKFLIETIKQKAKLGLEHVQEFTRALEESSDEEEEDDMPTLQLKQHGAASPVSTSDKISESETEKEEEEEGQIGSGKGGDSESGSDKEKDVPTVVIQDAEESDHDDDEEEDGEEALDSRARSSESPKKVRFAEEEARLVVKAPSRDVSVCTEDPDYDRFLFVRMYSPHGMTQEEFKCSVTYGKQFYKTKRLDTAVTSKDTEKAAAAGKEKADATKPEPAEANLKEIKKGRYEEAIFSVPEQVPEGIWNPDKQGKDVPTNCQITVHSGPKEEIIAMATIEIADLKELNLKEVFLPEPHGDDDVPKSPEPPETGDMDSLSEDMDIPLPDSQMSKAPEPGPPAVEEDRVKDVDVMMFPLYSLDVTTAKHKPCGSLPLIFYWGQKAKPRAFNRQVGTYGITELVFDLTGIDLDTTSKADLHKEMTDEALSAISFSPSVRDIALSALPLTPDEMDHPPQPPSSPEPVEAPPEPEPVQAPPEPVPVQVPADSPEIKEEMVSKSRYDQVVEKHSQDLLLLQEEYEKRLQSVLENLQIMEQTQKVQQQQLIQQQQQLQQQQQVNQQLQQQQQRKGSPRHGAAVSPVPAVQRAASSPEFHIPAPPRKPKKQKQRGQAKQWDEPPDSFLNRLQYFEDESVRHRQELENKTKKKIQDNIEKKLAGEHKLSRKDEEMFEALRDVSLPALFMPFKSGTIFNPRAHQYFHPTGSSDLRLSQPPSVFQLPPLPRTKSSIVNLFELSKNFNSRGPGWLMDRYIQQQEPVANAHGMVPQTPAPTTHAQSPAFTPQPTQAEFAGRRERDLPQLEVSEQLESQQIRETRELEAEC